jgi:hypothetical protein
MSEQQRIHYKKCPTLLFNMSKPLQASKPTYSSKPVPKPRPKHASSTGVVSNQVTDNLSNSPSVATHLEVSSTKGRRGSPAPRLRRRRNEGGTSKDPLALSNGEGNGTHVYAGIGSQFGRYVALNKIAGVVTNYTI